MIAAAFGEITERLRRVTVQVRAGANAGGSGVVWSDAGRIVTNAHVLQGDSVRVELWNGRQLTARVVKKDPRRDLAALEVEAEIVPFAAAGDSEALSPGELVIAVGNPYGFIGAVSTGVVHSSGSNNLVPGTWIVSSVRLAPGNSGGPLSNARGEVIGINTMIAGGLGFAIPSKAVLRFLAISSGSKAYLGVTVRPVQRTWKAAGDGLLVLEIASKSPAAQASLLPGDVLCAANHRRLSVPEDLEDALSASAGGPLEIQFRRGDSNRPRRVVVHPVLEPSRAA